MTASRLFNSIDYLATGHYALWAEAGKQTTISPDTPEYFNWLDTLPSFHFKGKHGHFTARREKRYWYAYRKAKKCQFKRYIGTTDRLTLTRLETVAAKLAEEAAAVPELPPAKRRKITETKGSLRGRVQHLERTVEQQKARVEELEAELATLKDTQAREGYNQTVRQRRKRKEE